MKNWKSMPRTGHSRTENSVSQPLRTETLFNNPDALVEGWYPLCRAKDLKTGEARSFVILKQRVAVWRGEDGGLRALDAFCPHMGADLGNGSVRGNELRCYFHHWQFSGEGQLTQLPCSKKTTTKAALKRYPVQEYLGHVWIYAGDEIRTPLITPPGLDQFNAHAVRLAEPTLFAHHHVMMAGGIDLQHFATVHQISIDFSFEQKKRDDHVVEWKMSGPIAPNGIRGKLSRWLIGDRLTYRMRIGAGSMVSISYGENQRLFGKFIRLPQLHVIWGCIPLVSGVSRVSVFSVVPRYRGVFGKLKIWAQHALTLMLIALLRDDDVKAFPNMRFQIDNPMPEDKPVLQLIHAINQMPESKWTAKSGTTSRISHLTIGL